MDEDGPFCGDCGGSREVSWSPVFREWLCADHRQVRTYWLLDLMPEAKEA